mgnify:CR=1 FL=1
MSGFSRDRNIKIPKKGEKKSSSTRTDFLPSRPAEGRVEIPKKSAKPQNNQQRRNNNSGKNNQRRRNNNRNKPRQQKPRQKRPTPLDEEIWARVIENDTKQQVIVALGESKMLLGRYVAKNSEVGVGDRIYVGVDNARRVDVGEILGMARIDLLSNAATSDLPLIMQIFIEENSKHFIDAFFNRAGPISLKQHAFELLPGIGNKKAMQMVEQRGSSGFSDIEQLNETCNIDSCELLAKRFVNEIEDKTLQPRLSELLFPVTA